MTRAYFGSWTLPDDTRRPGDDIPLGAEASSTPARASEMVGAPTVQAAISCADVYGRTGAPPRYFAEPHQEDLFFDLTTTKGSEPAGVV